ncbi:MAG: hypothetical protein QOD39_1565, partial [Mycobacterium sp.]|nr:hypothetical protein [Mycobacterium sp.]
MNTSGYIDRANGWARRAAIRESGILPVVRFLRRTLPVIAAVAVVLPAAACSSKASPDDAAKQFLATFAGGDTAGAAALTDSPDEAKALMDK